MNLSLFLSSYFLYPTILPLSTLIEFVPLELTIVCALCVCISEREEYMNTGQYKHLYNRGRSSLPLSLSPSCHLFGVMKMASLGGCCGGRLNHARRGGILLWEGCLMPICLGARATVRVGIFSSYDCPYTYKQTNTSYTEVPRPVFLTCYVTREVCLRSIHTG